MSIGNLKTDGNKGNNFPWQLKMLLGQQCACDALQELVDNTDTVEPLLAQILAAIQQGTDYEATLVVDANDVTWLEVRIWDPTPAPGAFLPPVYFAAGSNIPGTPVLPITYINPNTYLAQIVSNTTGLATELTLTAINNKLVNGNDIGDVTVNNGAGAAAVNIQDGGNSITVDGTVSLSTATLTALENITVQNGAGAAAVNIQDGGNSITVDAIDLDIRPLVCTDSVSICADGTPVGSGNPLPVSVTETNDSIQIYASDSVNNVPVLVGQQDCSDSLAVTLCTQQAQVQITPNIQISENDIATITDPVYSISFANIGTADALVSFDSGLNTVPLSPGVTVNMDAGGLGNFYASATFAWDTQSNLGSKLVITYNT